MKQPKAKAQRRTVFPTIAQLAELPIQFSGAIPPEWEDRNGHVNVQFYVALYELGGWVIFEDSGIDEDWFQQRDLSVFDLEHHLHFRAEVLVGDEVVTYNRLLSRNEKSFHGMYFIVNQTRGRLAATLEYVSACVDMSTRRIAPFPQQLAGLLDSLLEKHRQLGWTAPDCGLMKL
jgi:acyl-CoA thioester hydrolase